MANLRPLTSYVNFGNGTSTEYYAVAQWAALTSYTVGKMVRQLAAPSVNNERVFVQTNPTTHVSGVSEPSWTLTVSGSTTDATCTWYECTGNPAVNGDATNALTWAQQHASSTTVTTGLIIYDSVSGALQIVTTGGTIGGSAPSFSGTAGTTTTDNTVTWTSLGAITNFAGSSTWSAPHARMYNALVTGWYGTGSNTFFLGDDHAETQASTISFPNSGNASALWYVYDVDHTASVPPGGSNLKTTAAITTTGANGITILPYIVWTNVVFNAGTGSGIGQFTFQTVGWYPFTGCALNGFGTQGGGQGINCGILGVYLDLLNTTVSFGSSAQTFGLTAATLRWRNTASALGSWSPTTLFGLSGSNASIIICEGLDLSGVSSGNNIVGTPAGLLRASFTNCKITSGVKIVQSVSQQGCYAYTVVTDSSGTTYQQQAILYEGTLAPSTAIVRSGGATDGVTPIAWQITTTANSTWSDPFESFTDSQWNTTLSTNRGVTLYGAWNSANLPNNDQIWVEVESLGSASSPLGNAQTQTKANGLTSGSALPSDSTSTWGASATARPNSTSVSLGAAYYVAVSGGGGLFFVTTAGTTASSQPAGYTTATDGQTVTDGTAVLRAATRFTLTVTLSSPQPALTGYIRATVKAALPSNTWYVDPLITLS
jgi:hypothetical protein